MFNIFTWPRSVSGYWSSSDLADYPSEALELFPSEGPARSQRVRIYQHTYQIRQNSFVLIGLSLVGCTCIRAFKKIYQIFQAWVLSVVAH